MNRLTIGVIMSVIALSGCGREMDLPPAEKLALFKAVESGETDALKKAMGAGVSPDLQLPDSGYLISVATSFGNQRALQVLIEAGANVNARTPEGSGPLIVAMLGGRCEEARLLLKAGADPNEILTEEKAKKSALESELYDKTARELYLLNKQSSFRAPINIWEKSKACWQEVEHLMK